MFFVNNIKILFIFLGGASYFLVHHTTRPVSNHSAWVVDGGVPPVLAKAKQDFQERPASASKTKRDSSAQPARTTFPSLN